MPGRKGKTTPVQVTPEEPEETEEEGLATVAAQIKETMETGFSRLESVVEKLAGAVLQPKPAPNPRKRPAPSPANTHDTRNKALRAKYNPPKTNSSLIDNEVDQNTSYEDMSDDGDAIMVPEVVTKPPRKVRAQPAKRKPEPKNVNKQPVSPQSSAVDGKHDGKQDMNSWLISTAFNSQPTGSGQQLPMSVKDYGDDIELEQRVDRYLAATKPNIAQGTVPPGVFPFKYVRRGLENKRATFNSLTISEHLWAIFRIIRDTSVPSHIKPHLITHVEQVLEDSKEYDWQTAVRPWSDEVFSRVAEGRFTNGWASYHEIQMLRLTMSQASTARLLLHKESVTTQKHQQFQVQPDLRGGPPCASYNSQAGCQQPSGHLVNGRKVTHICGFCLFNAAAARPHSEFYCRNKQRQFAQPQTHF